MSEHKAKILWTQSQGDFLKGTYSREHSWTFDGGMTVAASSSPAAVRVPFSNPANVDPEEAFVASLSSCHMLTYLYVACGGCGSDTGTMVHLLACGCGFSGCLQDEYVCLAAY
jgi:hypothetical protein